ncbi:hypothetical protein A2U01_0101413, partial [Trifolium medium]|nr:hypothetical protein [Trifolium medium]
PIFTTYHTRRITKGEDWKATEQQ